MRLPRLAPAVNRLVFSAVLFAAAGRGACATAEPPAGGPSANGSSAKGARPDLDLLGRFEQPLVTAVLEIGEVFRGPEAANIEFIAAAHPVIMISEPLMHARQSGLALAHFERIAVAARSEWLAVAAFSDEPTLGKFRKLMFPEGREEAVGDRKLFVEGASRVGYETADRTLAMGTRTAIEKTLPPPAGEPAWGMREFLALAREKPLCAVQVDAATIDPQYRGEFGDHGLAPLFEARIWRWACKKTDQGLHIKLSAHFDNATQATAAIDASRNVQNMLVAYFNVAAIQMPVLLREQAQAHPEGPKIASAFESSIKRMSLAFGKNPPQATGGTVAIECEVTTETPAADLVFLLTLLPRAAKEPGKP